MHPLEIIDFHETISDISWSHIRHRSTVRGNFAADSERTAEQAESAV